ncbi:hypothetical protein QCE80_17045, partial [Staphylococcus aureus]|nr:hypothetical protein [Staphylococcus aureus]
MPDKRGKRRKARVSVSNEANFSFSRMKYAIHFTKQEGAERRGRSAGRLTARLAPEVDKRQVVVFH